MNFSGAAVAQLGMFAQMRRQAFVAAFALLATTLITVAQPGIDDQLMASARGALPQVSTNEIFQALGPGLWNSNQDRRRYCHREAQSIGPIRVSPTDARRLSGR